jgi:CRP-like cAMP-binding protein
MQQTYSSPQSHIRNYRPHELIVTEGVAPEHFFVVLQGSVEIIQNDFSVRILTENDVFGLENYYLQRPYTTTARALTRARIAAYATSLIKEIIFDRPQLAEKILSSIARQLEQTTEIATRHIPVDAPADTQQIDCTDGEVIIREGDTGTAMFRLVSSEGGLRVSRRGMALSLITKPGEIFGELSALLGTPRAATVVSCGTSVVEKISITNMDVFVASNPHAVRNLLVSLAIRMHSLLLKITA